MAEREKNPKEPQAGRIGNKGKNTNRGRNNEMSGNPKTQSKRDTQRVLTETEIFDVSLLMG